MSSPNKPQKFGELDSVSVWLEWILCPVNEILMTNKVSFAGNIKCAVLTPRHFHYTILLGYQTRIGNVISVLRWVIAISG